MPKLHIEKLHGGEQDLLNSHFYFISEEHRGVLLPWNRKPAGLQNVRIHKLCIREVASATYDSPLVTVAFSVSLNYPYTLGVIPSAAVKNGSEKGEATTE